MTKLVFTVGTAILLLAWGCDEDASTTSDVTDARADSNGNSAGCTTSTGGAYSATGGVSSATGGVSPATGGVSSATGGVSATGGSAGSGSTDITVDICQQECATTNDCTFGADDIGLLCESGRCTFPVPAGTCDNDAFCAAQLGDDLAHCSSDGYCYYGCNSNADCTSAQAPTCDDSRDQCVCTVDDDCSALAANGMPLGGCGCATDADCVTQAVPGHTKCNDGLCGCENADACLTIYDGTVAVCEAFTF